MHSDPLCIRAILAIIQNTMMVDLHAFFECRSTLDVFSKQRYQMLTAPHRPAAFPRSSLRCPMSDTAFHSRRHNDQCYDSEDEIGIWKGSEYVLWK